MTAAAAKKTEEALPRSIGEIIPLIRQEVGPIGKDEQATAGASYKFRGHDTIVNAIAPLFDKYGVYTTVEDTLLEYGGRNAGNKYATHSVISKKVTFHAPDGSEASSTVLGESIDYGNKATGQAETYAYRKALEQTFTLPTGQPDPDETKEEFAATSDAPTAATQAAQPQAARPSATVEDLRARVQELFAAVGITDSKEIAARGTKFFNGRENWSGNATALGKIVKALEAGEAVGE